MAKEEPIKTKLKKETAISRFLILVNGKLDPKWAIWLDVAGIQAEDNPTRTKISVAVPDQAALRGVMNKLWDLNLSIIELREVPDQGGPDERP